MAPIPNQLPPEVIAEIANGRIIEAIKILREKTGLGLKESKDAVDAYARSQPGLAHKIEEARAETKRSCLLWVAGFLAIVAAACYFLLRAR